MIEQLSIWENVKPYFKLDKPIRLIELFAGIGSQHQAIKNLGLEINRSTICEWSIQSTQAYNDIHVQDYTDYSKGKSKDELIAILSGLGVSSDYNAPMSAEQLKRKSEAQLRTIYNNIVATNNLVNITRAKGDDLNIAETDKYIYIMTYSFPCQDLSKAGKLAGMSRDGGTRSGLLWEVERLLKETKNLPQILLMENVPDVIGTNNIKHFQEWEMWLASIGYSNYCEILNAKDYGIPQNRNRAFMVSILGDYLYRFPQKQELKLRLKDMLELEVDEKYYLSEKMLDGMLKTKYSSYKSAGGGVVLIPEATEKGYAEAQDGDGVYLNRPHQKRGVVQKGMVQTIKTSKDDLGVVESSKPADNNEKEKTTAYFKNQKCHLVFNKEKKPIGHLLEFPKVGFVINNNQILFIRKLTCYEVWRLMGFKDEQFDLAQQHQSNSTLYHQAGDSIVVNVLEAIFKPLIKESKGEIK